MSELGLSPPGNLEPVQRSLWEKPGDAGSISERGRSAAGSAMAKAFLQTMADRGLKEEVGNSCKTKLVPTNILILSKNQSLISMRVVIFRLVIHL